jgi:carboxymethylenebutenolidase
MCTADTPQVQIPAEVHQLLAAQQAGRLTRRDFVEQAGDVFARLNLKRIYDEDSHSHHHPTATHPFTPLMTVQPAKVAATTGGMITIQTSHGTTPGYLAQPDAAGKYPGVVVIQEWWGLDAHIKSVADKFARAGFVALAPDLYHGEIAREPDEARKLAMSLIADQANADIQGAADYLTSLDSVQPKKVGTVGFCMGGGISLRMSWIGKDNIGAVVVFYGGAHGGITDEQFKSVHAPVLGLFGEEDKGIPVESVKQWEAKFKEFGKTNEMIIYPNAGHAFFNDTRPAYRPDVAEDAFQRATAWFMKYLKISS